MRKLPNRFATAAALLSITMLGACNKGHDIVDDPFISPNSPESAVRAFYKALDNSEVAQARSLFLVPGEGAAGAASIEGRIVYSLRKEAELTASCGGIKDVKLSIADGKGDIRQANNVITYGGKCAPKTELMKLMKVKGVWKVSDFQPLQM